jgi:SAM-dependent methyltransferase
MAGGSYRGFDVHLPSITWCRGALAPRSPSFTFDHHDVRNGVYNPKSRADAATFSFPYQDERFDFVIATSLFTHMLRDEVINYLSEFGRVLRPGGVAFTTAYLLNSASVISMVGAPDAVKFTQHACGDALVQAADRPVAAVAMPEDWLRSDARAAGLSVDRVAYGAWSGARRLTKQDVMILRRDG